MVRNGPEGHFEQQVRKIGARLAVLPDDPDLDGERTVVLRRCATVTGRRVDADGNPTVGAS